MLAKAALVCLSERVSVYAPRIPVEPGYLVNIASVYLPQDVILRLLAFLSF